MENIKELDAKCENIIETLRQNQEEAFQGVTKLMPELIVFLQQFMITAEKWNAMGGDLPIEVIVQQIKNLNEAYGEKDVIMLADTLEYEIRNSIAVFLEIINA